MITVWVTSRPSTEDTLRARESEERESEVAVVQGGPDGPSSAAPADVLTVSHATERPQTLDLESGGADETRTRDLWRDRPAF